MSTSPHSSTSDQQTGGQEPHNQADVQFANGMIPHHAKALRMSKTVLQRDDTRLTDFARQIEDAQRPEIETMKQWLTAWGEDVPDTAVDPMESGQMDDLKQRSGADFDTLWLKMMIEHHQTAIEMAQTQVAEGKAADAVALAQQDIEDQQAEIEEMNHMTTELHN